MPRHEWEHGWWEISTATPHPLLASKVRGEYTGWSEWSRQPMRRREVASTVIPLIINLGPAYRILSGHDAHRAEIGETQHSFVAGLYDTWAAVESDSVSCALQVIFSPLGARQLLGVSMHELAGHTVDVSALLGDSGQQLIEQIGSAPNWQARFDILDRFLCARLHTARVVPAEVSWVWEQIANADGNIRIVDLTRSTGWSAKRLIASFREHVGLPPKTVARIVRFERLIARLNDPVSMSWAQHAVETGFYDQSHLVRDFQAFAGCTPSMYLRERLPSAGGVVSV